MPSLMLSTMSRYFLAVAEARSVTEAGQRLHVAPSAVSRQVALLEETMGCALFERQARGMALTEAGERLLLGLRGVQDDLEAVQRRVQGVGPASAQRLQLACTEGFTTGFMPQVMGSFRRDHTGVRLFLRVGDAEQIDTWLQRGEVDVGLRFATRPADGVSVVAQASSPIVAVVAPGHPLALASRVAVKELVRHPLALPDRASTVRQVLDTACALAALRYDTACTGNLPTLIALVAQGQLVMLCSRLSVMQALQAGGLVAVPVDEPAFRQRQVQLLVRAGRAPSDMAQHFLSHTSAQLQASAPP
jgi:DNA-binding transcriptional LysR family regulator